MNILVDVLFDPALDLAITVLGVDDFFELQLSIVDEDVEFLIVLPEECLDAIDLNPLEDVEGVGFGNSEMFADLEVVGVVVDEKLAVVNMDFLICIIPRLHLVLVYALNQRLQSALLLMIFILLFDLIS